MVSFKPLMSQQIDTLEYSTGNLTAQQQLLNYPLPRFKPNNGLNKNFIWFGLGYFSGRQQPNVTNQMMINTAKIDAVEFYTNWNYYFPVTENLGTYSSPSNYADTINNLNAALVSIAKRNPSWKTSAISFWAQINGNVTNKNLSSDHYLRNTSGQFIDLSGNMTTNKFWSPVAPNLSIISDGEKQRNYLINLTNALGRPVTILNENGEVLPLISRNGGVLNNDPFVRSDYDNLSYPPTLNILSTNDYRGRKFTDQTILYRDKLLSASQSTIFTHYGLDGQTDYRPVWGRSKYINSPINGRYYPTGDFYPRWPNNWRSWAGAWHGLGWFADCKYWEMQSGDSLFSPFVCAGWNIDETKNMRPAQYLATLKILSNWGAEFFYTGYFSLSAPFPDSKNWAWQTVIPVYAQAISSRYETFLKKGYSLDGDVPRYYLTSTTLWPNNPKYLFNTGDNRQLVAVRKLYDSEKYIITTAQMVDSNTIGNAPNVSYGKFKLGTDSLKVEFRRQGSVYYFDKNLNIFFQLDKWHQYQHPERWNKDIEIEAEVYDSIQNSTLKSYGIVRVGNNVDMTNVLTTIELNSNSKVWYSFNSRESSRNNVSSTKHFIWVRARNKTINTVSQIEINVNNWNSIFIPCIDDTNWTWYKTRRWFRDRNHTLIFSTNSNVEIDKIYITTSDDPITNEQFEYCYSIGRFGEEVKNEVDIRVIPTIVDDFASIDLISTKNVSGVIIVFDSMGKVVYENNLDIFADTENTSFIQTSKLSQGTYVVSFHYEGKKAYNKFVKL